MPVSIGCRNLREIPSLGKEFQCFTMTESLLHKLRLKITLLLYRYTSTLLRTVVFSLIGLQASLILRKMNCPLSSSRTCTCHHQPKSFNQSIQDIPKAGPKGSMVDIHYSHSMGGSDGMISNDCSAALLRKVHCWCTLLQKSIKWTLTNLIFSEMAR
jgi:hypothetical protein